MSNEENTPSFANFSDMNLRVGQRVQLLSEAPVLQKYYANLIGYLENEFLILRIPHDEGWIAHLNEGMRVEVRLFSGVSIFSFNSHIDTLLLNPRNHMLMSFPDKIQEVRMRSHARVRTHMPVDIVEAASAAIKETGFHLCDLSGSGASVLGPASLGPIGARVRLGFDFTLESTNQLERVELNGTIQNSGLRPSQTADGDPVQYLHGVQFDTVDPRILLLVHELQ
jgi:hypothetical protein